MSTSGPLVSVVVPCYNHARYVQACIRSIIGQGYSNIELIVIDDGSQDESSEKIRELVSECEQRFVRFEFRARPNQGLCATLNEAIAWCRGEFYSAIASDDLMLPDKTSRQVQYFLDNPDCDALFSGMYVVDSNGGVVSTRCAFAGSANFEDILVKRRSLQAPTQMLRLSALREAGPYPEGLYIEDWYMWLRLAFLGKNICSIPGPLACYRRHGSNMSGGLGRMHEARLDIVRQYKSHSLYRKGVASCYLSSAIDSQKDAYFKSFSFLVNSVKISPQVVFHLRFMKYLLKAFVYLVFHVLSVLRLKS